MDRDNQQATPTEAEIAWLSGIIEGEGTLMMSLWRRNDGPDRKPKVGLQIKIYNSDAGIIRHAVDILERFPDVVFHIKEREMPAMAKHGGGGYAPTAPMLTVTISRLSSVYALLKAIRPWLFGDKSARADLMLKFLERRFAKFRDETMGKRAPYDAGDIRLVLAFANGGKRGNIAMVEGVLNELEQCPAPGG